MITTQVQVETGTAQGIQRSLDHGLKADVNHGTVQGLCCANRVDFERMNVYSCAGTKLAGDTVHGF
ncbi:hypothetical protein D3C79_1045130 [compost metagenome]